MKKKKYAQVSKIDAVSFPTSSDFLKQHMQLAYERGYQILEEVGNPSIMVDFTVEGRRYRGVAFPVESEAAK